MIYDRTSGAERGPITRLVIGAFLLVIYRTSTAAGNAGIPPTYADSAPAAQSIWYLNPGWYTFIAVVISALIAGVAYLGQREMTRKRATLDLLHRVLWDGDCIDAISTFNELARPTELDLSGTDSPKNSDYTGLAVWADPRHRDSPQMRSIRTVLNHYELLALGVRTGIIDEPFFYYYQRRTFVRNWGWAKRFVELIREQEEKRPKKPGEVPLRILYEYQGLVEQWDKGRSFKNKGKAVPPVDASLWKRIKKS